MAVAIRLSRLGTKNRPYWRIVAVDSRKKRDGAFLDNIGTYDPVKHELLQFHEEKFEQWISKGAQCSDAVKKIRKINKKSKNSVAA